MSLKFGQVQREQQQLKEVINNQQQTMARQHEVVSYVDGSCCPVVGVMVMVMVGLMAVVAVAKEQSLLALAGVDGVPKKEIEPVERMVEGGNADGAAKVTLKIRDKYCVFVLHLLVYSSCHVNCGFCPLSTILHSFVITVVTCKA